MGKRPEKTGVGQLVLQILFPDEGESSHGTEGTEGNGLGTSAAPSAVGSKPERKRKWYSLIDKVYARPNLQAAWEHVAAKEGAPGIDGISIEQFARNADERLEQLAADLRNKSYRPQPVRRVFIPKEGGTGDRPLGIPTVRDRIVQEALRRILEPIFERKFSERSHGFRPERGCHTALDVVDRAVRYGYEWVVDADIASFFDSVDHDRLIRALNEEIADGSVLNLITHILRAGVRETANGPTLPTERGTPQGGPLSPLLANVYLHRFDEEVVAARYGLVRYADDFVIFAKSDSEATAALELARKVLEDDLGLTLHPEKTRVVAVAAGFAFLGYRYFRCPKTGALRKEVSAKATRRFREAIRRKTPRLRNQTLPKQKNITPARLKRNRRLRAMIGAVTRYLRGWHWYFKGVWVPGKAPFRAFDQFVRRRIRSAITGRVGSGWWHNEIPNALLRELGLIGVDEWQERYRQGQLEAPAPTGKFDGEPYAGKPHVRFGKAGEWATTP